MPDSIPKRRTPLQSLRDRFIGTDPKALAEFERLKATMLMEDIGELQDEVERLRAVVPKMAQLLRDYLESCAFLHQAEGEIGYGPCSCETCVGAREILREIEGG